MLFDILKLLMYMAIFSLTILSFLYALTLKTKLAKLITKKYRIAILLGYCVLMVVMFLMTDNPYVQRAAAGTIPLVLVSGGILIRQAFI